VSIVCPGIRDAIIDPAVPIRCASPVRTLGVADWSVAMFDLGPEKILMILAVACMFLGPTELPKAARKIGAVRGQLRSWQDALRAEVGSALAFDADPSLDAERTVPATVVAPEPVPERGDSFN